jgi:hypothetical protein
VAIAEDDPNTGPENESGAAPENVIGATETVCAPTPDAPNPISIPDAPTPGAPTPDAPNPTSTPDADGPEIANPIGGGLNKLAAPDTDFIAAAISALAAEASRAATIAEEAWAADAS